MEPTELRSKLTGVLTFPITIFHKDWTLDLKGLRQNLEVLMTHPLSAVVAAGGTGEMFSLNPSEYLEVVRTTVEIGKGKMPVLAATGINYPLSLEMAKAAATVGVDGLLLFPPYYPNADIEGLFQYYQSIADATPLGVIIYSRDWANFSPAQVERLAEIPNLIAWKDGQADIRRLQMIMNRLGDRLHWIGGAGDDMVPGYYALGIRTYTSSIANVAPRLSLKLHELAARQDTTELPDLMARFVTPLYALRARRKGYEVSAMKVMMDAVEGWIGGPVRPPLVEVTDAERHELNTMVELWKDWL